MSASVNSFASAVDGERKRCTRRVTASADPRTFVPVSLSEMRSHPASVAPPRASNVWRRNVRRSVMAGCLGFIRCLVYAVPARDHAAKLVERAAQEDLGDVDHDEGHEAHGDD